MQTHPKRILVLAIVLLAACFLALPETVSAQYPVPVITYYSGPPVTVYYPSAPVYAAPTTVYYAPAPAPTVVYRPEVVYPMTTTYYAPTPSVYIPPQPTVVYRRGPLGLINWPTIAYTPGVIVR